MNQPIHTVIVPYYNVEKYVDKCISSKINRNLKIEMYVLKISLKLYKIMRMFYNRVICRGKEFS